MSFTNIAYCAKCKKEVLHKNRVCVKCSGDTNAAEELRWSKMSFAQKVEELKTNQDLIAEYLIKHLEGKE